MRSARNRVVTGSPAFQPAKKLKALILRRPPSWAAVSKDATGTAEPVAILRDAPLRSGAPQDEVEIFHTLVCLRPDGLGGTLFGALSCLRSPSLNSAAVVPARSTKPPHRAWRAHPGPAASRVHRLPIPAAAASR